MVGRSGGLAERTPGGGEAFLQLRRQVVDVGWQEHAVMITGDVPDAQAARRKPFPASGTVARGKLLGAPEERQVAKVVAGRLVAPGSLAEAEMDFVEADELIQFERPRQPAVLAQPFVDLWEEGAEVDGPPALETGAAAGLRHAVGPEEIIDLRFRRYARGAGLGGRGRRIEEGEEGDGLSGRLELTGDLERNDTTEGPATEQVGAGGLQFPDRPEVERGECLNVIGGVRGSMEGGMFEAEKGLVRVQAAGEGKVGDDLAADGMDAEERRMKGSFRDPDHGGR